MQLIDLSTSLEMQIPKPKPMVERHTEFDALRFVQQQIGQRAHQDLVNRVSALSLECQKLSQEKEQLRIALSDYECIIRGNTLLLAESLREEMIDFVFESAPVVTQEEHRKSLERLASLKAVVADTSQDLIILVE